MTLYSTDLDLEAVFFDDTCTDEWVRAERELELIKACEEHIAYAHAIQSRALARFAKLRPGIEHDSRMSEFAVDEIALAAGWTQGIAGQRLNLARSLTERLPGTLDALERGKIDLRRAQKLADLTDMLAPEVAQLVEDTVLPKAATQNPNALARTTSRVIARLDPEGVQERRTARKKD